MTELGNGMIGDTRAAARPFKGRRLVVLLGVALLMTLVFGLMLNRRGAPDPTWNEHRLSHYVDLLPATYTAGDDGYTIYPIHTHKWRNLSQPQQAVKWNEHEQRANVARAAIVAIGADGLPWLLHELGRDDSAVERGLGKSPQWMQNLLLKAGYRASPTPTYHQRWQVVTALRELRRARIDMSPVIADLLVLATNPSPDIRLAATFLIKQIDSAQLALLNKSTGNNEASAGLTSEGGN